MEPQEFAFLGRVSQFLKQWSCLGANISLYCPASEGSQESRQAGGRVAGFFPPPPQRGQEPQNRQVGVGKSSLALGDAEELGEDRKGSQAETCTGLWFKSSPKDKALPAPGDAGKCPSYPCWPGTPACLFHDT